jgi:predicted DNA-binding transcriptional regulator AlpA
MSHLADKRLLKRREVCYLFGGIDGSTLYRHIRKGSIPRPIHVGGSSRWLLTECEVALQQMIGGRA